MANSTEETDSSDPEVVFSRFLTCFLMQDIVKTFNCLKKLLGLDNHTKLDLYRALKEKLTSWKCKSLWNELDNRANQKVGNEELVKAMYSVCVRHAIH